MQVKEKMNVSSYLFAGNQSEVGQSTSEIDKKSDFASFLSTSVSQIQSNSWEKNYSEEKLNCGQVQDSQKTTSKPKNDEETVSVKKDSECQSEKVKDVSDIEDTNALELEELSDEEQRKVLEAVSSVLQMLMEQFGLSAKELMEQLEMSGMDVNQLLSVEGIRDFFLSINSADLSDLIVNEDMNFELQEVLQEFEDLLQQFDVEEELLQSSVAGDDISVLLSEDALSDGTENVMGSTGETEVLYVQNEKTVTQNKSTSSDSDSQNERMSSAEQSDVQNPILQAIDDAMNSVEDVSFAEQNVQSKEIVNQIVEQIRVSVNQNTTSMELQLYPEHLGKIQIHVVSKDGVMTARIISETELARQAIEEGLSVLKESMEQQNLKVDAIEVMVSTAGFDKGNEKESSYEQENSSHSKSKIEFSELNEEIIEEDAETEKMKVIGSSVSYSA